MVTLIAQKFFTIKDRIKFSENFNFLLDSSLLLIILIESSEKSRQVFGNLARGERSLIVLLTNRTFVNHRHCLVYTLLQGLLKMKLSSGKLQF